MMSAQMLASVGMMAGTVSDLAPGGTNDMRMLEAMAAKASSTIAAEQQQPQKSNITFVRGETQPKQVLEAESEQVRQEEIFQINFKSSSSIFFSSAQKILTRLISTMTMMKKRMVSPQVLKDKLCQHRFSEDLSKMKMIEKDYFI
jgi:hypothetical protein